MNTEEMWLLKEKYDGEKTEGFFTDCARLASGEPLAYVIGHIPFLNTTIYLDDSHPLIPRPETEYWVEKVIKKIQDQGLTSITVLDLCAGSGCIGVAVLKVIPQARVDFAEIDPSHHATISKNIIMNSIDPSRANIFGGNLFENSTGKYDYILSNPPYIDSNLARTDTSVIAHEPHIALFGGDDGLSLIRQIIIDAPRFLAKSGTLVLEHEQEQSDAITVAAAIVGFRVNTHKDQFGIERYTHLTRIPTENVSR
jgi:release factor glutamine methyltransferase